MPSRTKCPACSTWPGSAPRRAYAPLRRSPRENKPGITLPRASAVTSG
jgi:hypothetical protein